MAEVQIPVNENTEDQAYIDAMVKKAEDGVTPNSGQPQAAPTDGKPEWLGDFESPEAMAKAYNELRTKMSQEGAPKGEPAQEPEGDAEVATEGDTEASPEGDAASRDEAAEAAEAAGIDMSAVEAEFMTDGALSDATYEKLSKAGFDKNTVDAYIAGQQALGEQMQARIEAHVGGADKLSAALEWAQTGLTAEEQTAFNNAIDKADEAGVKLAMDGLMAKFAKSEGSEPKLLGGATKASSGSVFRSTAELTAAMNDPRYSRDPAYRADVEQRLARSDIF
jgi:hypothetical protein